MKGQNWTFRIGTSLAAAVALAVFTTAQTKGKQPIAALVNGEAITLDEVDAILQRKPSTASPLPEVQRRQMQLDALSMLIDDKLVQQFLQTKGCSVPPAEV